MEFETMVSLGKEISTVIFFTFFMFVLFYAYNSRNKEKLESIKFSIFDEEEIRRMSDVKTRGT
ncbi:MAG: CcoQ/FixQ family Cbb3-type cytochrome c oxidase assembly chaperone [Candidatus Sericytochromatia bacterium]|jgi:cbb3-type cytochrome oxidase subunit 3